MSKFKLGQRATIEYPDDKSLHGSECVVICKFSANPTKDYKVYVEGMRGPIDVMEHHLNRLPPKNTATTWPKMVGLFVPETLQEKYHE